MRPRARSSRSAVRPPRARTRSSRSSAVTARPGGLAKGAVEVTGQELPHACTGAIEDVDLVGTVWTRTISSPTRVASASGLARKRAGKADVVTDPTEGKAEVIAGPTRGRVAGA